MSFTPVIGSSSGSSSDSSSALSPPDIQYRNGDSEVAPVARAIVKVSCEQKPQPAASPSH